MTNKGSYAIKQQQQQQQQKTISFFTIFYWTMTD